MGRLPGARAGTDSVDKAEAYLAPDSQSYTRSSCLEQVYGQRTASFYWLLHHISTLRFFAFYLLASFPTSFLSSANRRSSIMDTLTSFASSLPSSISALDSNTIAKASFALVLSATLYRIAKAPRNLPPGPRGWPIIGNLLDVPLDVDFWKTFREWGRRYGESHSSFRIVLC